jgi:hypothetical protein
VVGTAGSATQGNPKMSWKQTTVTVLGDALGFLGRACALVDIILISVFSVWLVAKFLWHTMTWLNKTVFNSPW